MTYLFIILIFAIVLNNLLCLSFRKELAFISFLPIPFITIFFFNAGSPDIEVYKFFFSETCKGSFVTDPGMSLIFIPFCGFGEEIGIKLIIFIVSILGYLAFSKIDNTFGPVIYLAFGNFFIGNFNALSFNFLLYILIIALLNSNKLKNFLLIISGTAFHTAGTFFLLSNFLSRISLLITTPIAILITILSYSFLINFTPFDDRFFKLNGDGSISNLIYFLIITILFCIFGHKKYDKKLLNSIVLANVIYAGLAINIIFLQINALRFLNISFAFLLISLISLFSKNSFTRTLIFMGILILSIANFIINSSIFPLHEWILFEIV